jgi:hypothetical protein
MINYRQGAPKIHQMKEVPLKPESEKPVNNNMLSSIDQVIANCNRMKEQAIKDR